MQSFQNESGEFKLVRGKRDNPDPYLLFIQWRNQEGKDKGTYMVIHRVVR